MKVLHLPVNIGSGPFHTVKALRHVGIDARLFLTTYHRYQSVPDSEEIHVVDRVRRRRHSPVRYWKRWTGYYLFWKYLQWADVLHWHFTTRVLPLGLDFRLIQRLRKPALVEFHGSEIRIPEVERQDNPYYVASYKKESYERSRRNQQAFANAGFAALIDPADLLQYIQRDIFPTPYLLRRRFFLNGVDPRYPDPTCAVPVIAHSPSNRPVKGTQYILEAIERLKNRRRFEFILIEDKSREECLELVRRADIFIDQLVLGWHGMAAVEAMALGKPAVCYIKPSLASNCPPEFPVVHATVDTLEEVLDRLIQDGTARYEIGKRSRAYVEQYHNAVKLVPDLLKIYREVVQSRSRCAVAPPDVPSP